MYDAELFCMTILTFWHRNFYTHENVWVWISDKQIL